MEQPATSPASSSPSEAERAEDQFFDALRASDVERLDQLLAQDFLVVDVISGAVIERAAFIAALRDGLLEFKRVHLVERVARQYGDVAIIVGHTELSGSFDAASFTAASRYTHVLRRDRDGRWRLVSGQGTRIAEA